MLTNVFFFCRVSKSQNESADDFEKRRSQAAIRAQAKKELEKEQQVQQEIKKMKDTYGDKTVELEAPRCVLTVHCPVVIHFVAHYLNLFVQFTFS